MALSRRGRLGLAGLLLLIVAVPILADAFAAQAPQPVLHPNLDDALAGGFQLMVGQAPFQVRLWLDDAAGYQPAWDLAGGQFLAADAAASRVVRFDQPGVYYPSVTLTRLLRPTLTLTQKIVVLGSAPAADLGGRYGVNQDLAWDAPEDTQPEVDLMRAAGIEWLRLPIRWSWVEPQPGLYDWAINDRVVAQAGAAGLRLLAVLGSTPGWASGVTQSQVPAGAHADAYAPRRTSDFARYVYQTVEHYHGRVVAYEVLNEPNSINHWRPQPDAARFTELLCAGYYAAKYSDPAAVIVAGGLNGNGLYLGWETPESRDFLKAIYAGPAARCFDVMAIHPYAHPVENGLAALQQWVDEARAYMRAQNDPRPLWLTEVGWSNGPALWGHTAISEQQQAAWVQAVYQHLAGPDKIFWYNFKDGTDPAGANPEYHWGLLRDGLAPKPAYGALQAVPK